MDILSLKAALDLGKKALEIVRRTKELLPNGKEKDTARIAINEADTAFKLAESKIAQDLGYQLCRCTWPPQIMLSIEQEEYGEKFQCPKCKSILSSEMPPL